MKYSFPDGVVIPKDIDIDRLYQRLDYVGLDFYGGGLFEDKFRSKIWACVVTGACNRARRHALSAAERADWVASAIISYALPKLRSTGSGLSSPQPPSKPT